MLQLLRALPRERFTPLHAPTVTGELQEGVMKTRMQPIGNAWPKLPRLVRDLSRDLEKRSIWSCTAGRPNSTGRCWS